MAISFQKFKLANKIWARCPGSSLNNDFQLMSVEKCPLSISQTGIQLLCGHFSTDINLSALGNSSRLYADLIQSNVILFRVFFLPVCDLTHIDFLVEISLIIAPSLSYFHLTHRKFSLTQNFGQIVVLKRP